MPRAKVAVVGVGHSKIYRRADEPLGKLAVDAALAAIADAGLEAKDIDGVTRLCCTNPVWDSSHESSVVAGIHEQTYTPDLQDQELASLQ